MNASSSSVHGHYSRAFFLQEYGGAEASALQLLAHFARVKHSDTNLVQALAQIQERVLILISKSGYVAESLEMYT